MAVRFQDMRFLLKQIILFILILFIQANDEFEGQISLPVEHSLDFSPNALFEPRGTINIKSIRNGVATYNADLGLSYENRDKLKLLVQDNSFYRIKILTKPDNPDHYVSTFVRACSLYESRLSDHISLHLDQSGEILGVSLTTENMLCQGLRISDAQIANFNTTVEIQQMENGPVPDTASYIQKVEKEKAEKAKGEQGDNRSFFAKYWMYIVPVFIFLLISGAANPEAQGGGGGR